MEREITSQRQALPLLSFRPSWLGSFFLVRHLSVSKSNGCAQCQAYLVGYNKPTDFNCGTYKNESNVFFLLSLFFPETLGTSFFCDCRSHFFSSWHRNKSCRRRLGVVSRCVWLANSDLNVMPSRRLYDNQIMPSDTVDERKQIE